VRNKFMFPKQSSTVVKLLGEQLSPVLWQGEQWAVTDYGIENRDGTYHVDAKWFFKNDQGKHNWFMHMRDKSWCDMDDFEDACEVMYMLFNKNGTRNDVPAPITMSQAEIEEYAIQAAEEAYLSAKQRANHWVRSS